MEANRPDIVVLDEKECRALIIGVTIPMDINTVKAAAGTYDPGGRTRLRYGMPKSGWLARLGVSSGESRPDPKRSFTWFSSYSVPYFNGSG
eukprot:9193677-Ditylum_brightwellii.AAC.1